MTLEREGWCVYDMSGVQEVNGHHWLISQWVHSWGMSSYCRRLGVFVCLGHIFLRSQNLISPSLIGLGFRCERQLGQHSGQALGSCVSSTLRQCSQTVRLIPSAASAQTVNTLGIPTPGLNQSAVFPKNLTKDWKIGAVSVRVISSNVITVYHTSWDYKDKTLWLKNAQLCCLLPSSL